MTGDRSITIPAATMTAAFEKLGFTKGVSGHEIVFTRTHHRCKHLTVTVFSTLSDYEDVSRGVGDDAIKITAVYKRQRKGKRPYTNVVCKTSRVYRTAPRDLPVDKRVQAVIDRALERAREAYAACNEYCRGEHKCFACCLCVERRKGCFGPGCQDRTKVCPACLAKADAPEDDLHLEEP